MQISSRQFSLRSAQLLFRTPVHRWLLAAHDLWQRYETRPTQFELVCSAVQTVSQPNTPNYQKTLLATQTQVIVQSCVTHRCRNTRPNQSPNATIRDLPVGFPTASRFRVSISELWSSIHCPDSKLQTLPGRESFQVQSLSTSASESIGLFHPIFVPGLVSRQKRSCLSSSARAPPCVLGNKVECPSP